MTFHRYHRQMLLPGLGEPGQRMLAEAHALIVGCGALGSVIADSLARAGVGTLTLVDRDIVELTNLQRQILYDQNDVAGAVPKAEAARARLAEINDQIVVRAFVKDFNHRNAERFVDGVDVIVDGLDNFETRYLLNDLAVAHHLPYVYGGAVGTSGMSATILPHPGQRLVAGSRRVIWNEAQATPCLRCLFPEAPPPGTTPTCDTAGVLGPLVLTVAAHQAAQAIKLLTGNLAALDRSLWTIELWSNRTRSIDVTAARQPSCPCCGQGRFDYARGAAAAAATALCGRDAVQIGASDGAAIDLETLARRLAPHGDFHTNGFLLRGAFREERSRDGGPIGLTLFPDGRAIISGLSEPEAARAIYAKFVGG